MRIIIAGAGQVGIALAKYLREENHDIVLIDKDEETLGNLSEQLDIQTICGSSAYPAVLEKAGAQHADVFLAVTGNDETNIVACGVAKSVFNIQKRIARISSSEFLAAKYRSFLQDQSIEYVISPEVETVNRIMKILPLSGAVEMVGLSDDLVRFVGLKCKKTSPMVGKTVLQLHNDFEGLSVKVVAIVRKFQRMPLKNTIVRTGDEVYFVIDKRHLVQTLDILGYENDAPRYIILFGGGRLGAQLAKGLEQDVNSHEITIVEKNENRARFLAEHMQSSLIINGDGLDDSLVEELNLKNYEVAIATTHSDENNILLSLIAKRNGVPRTFSLIQNDLYDSVLPSLGVDTMIDPNAAMVSSILQHIRKGRIKNDYFLQSGVGEVLEIEVLKTSKITKSPLGKIKLPDGIVIGGIVRGDLFLMPNKDLIVQEGDNVIIFVERGHVDEVEKLFSVGFSFF